MSPDRPSPQIPDEAVEAALAAHHDGLYRYTVMTGPHGNEQRVAMLKMQDALSAAAPALYRAWAAQLVERIRTEGAKDANLDEGFGGDLHECIADEAGSWSGEFWRPQDIADGCAEYVADLLGLDGEGER